MTGWQPGESRSAPPSAVSSRSMPAKARRPPASARPSAIKPGEGGPPPPPRPPDAPGPTGLPIHPAVLDAAFQTLGAALSGMAMDAHLPVSLDGLTLNGLPLDGLRLAGASPD